DYYCYSGDGNSLLF
nr:immunoglobulin light chain junction region [Macaca mulatta]